MAFARTFLLLAATLVPAVHSLTNYANDFIDPNYVLTKNWNYTTLPSQKTIIQWANQGSEGGPWSVTSKPYLAPSGDKHDYMSWAPYWWPDCSQVGNTTELTPEEVWKTCPYVSRDGQFNPDGRVVNNIGDFDDMANAVLYNALAWAIDGSSTYSSRVASYIRTWFLAEDTRMNPNLNYAQMQRGPTGQTGSHTGILDLKAMAKLASGVLALRLGKAPEWTSDIDSGLVEWAKQYTQWLTSAEIALEEKAATNNHGSFYFNQLAAIQVLCNDNAGAQKTIEEYFNGIYLGQITANGDQPLESARTRPYHYRAYNLAAMITNARIGQYVGTNFWNKTTNEGVTMQAAADYAITLSADKEDAAELYPPVAAIASVYGDPDKKYSGFLANAAQSAYVNDANFFWNQPLDDHGYAPKVSGAAAGGSTPAGGASGSKATDVGTIPNAAVGGVRAWAMLYGACAVVMGVSFTDFL